MNDTIWKFLLSITSNFTDNIFLVFAIYCVLFGGIFAVLYVFLFKQRLVALLLNLPFLLSVYRCIERLPMLHSRIKLALSNTATIILQSDDYTKYFEKLSGLDNPTNRQVAEYLYNTKTDFTKTIPSELYESLGRVFEKTRTLFGVRVDTCSLELVLTTFVICLLLFFIWFLKGESIYRYPAFLLLSMASSFGGAGVLSTCIVLCLVEEIYIQGLIKRKKR